MSKILIRNFGPIREGYMDGDGFIDIPKCTIFIGSQGSGKSTVAKAISTMCWIEKALYKEDIEATNNLAWFQGIFEYQGIRNYFNDETIIEYIGDAYRLRYEHAGPLIEKVALTQYHVPKIMYVPAERNFLTVVENANDVKSLPLPLITFGQEFTNGKRQLGNESLPLPVGFGNVRFKHAQATDTSYLTGEDYTITLPESSSGFQSFIPMYVVSRFLSLSVANGPTNRNRQLSINQLNKIDGQIADVMSNDSLTDKEKTTMVNEIRSRYINTCFINIVEEPEQNLFPASQRSALNSLLSANNLVANNSLILTTHSPYIINYLTLAIKADSLLRKITESGKTDLLPRLEAIVPQSSTIPANDVAIYELEAGRIQKLPDYNGLPSDENYLNEKLAEGNELFAQLLEIEEAL